MERELNNRRTFLHGISPDFLHGKKGVFNYDYEEPTCLTFKIIFGNNIRDSYYSDPLAALTLPAQQNQVNSVSSSYDLMPTPFFQLKAKSEFLAENATFVGKTLTNKSHSVYSAYDYLYNSNQAHRAELLLEFVQGWAELQTQYQYFFTQVDGIQNALKIAPADGQRVKNLKLKVTFRDSIDQRVRYLLSLYRRIVWDDVYQRWALPDMMRFFRVYVFVSEIRVFHEATTRYKANKEKATGVKAFGKSVWNTAKSAGKDALKNSKNKLLDVIPETGVPIVDDWVNDKTGKNLVSDKIGKTPEYSLDNLFGLADFVYETVNNIAPITVYCFDMCDIDLDSINSIVDSSYTNTTPGNEKTYSFTINARNVRVIEHYNILREAGRWPGSAELTYGGYEDGDPYSFDVLLANYLDDFTINKYYRNLGTVPKEVDSYVMEYESALEDTSVFNDTAFMGQHEIVHIPGLAYHKNDMSTGIDPANIGNKLGQNSLTNKLVGSAIKAAAAMGTNYVTGKAKGLLNRKIGGTGMSVNDIFGALKSGDAMGLINKISGAVETARDSDGNAVGLLGPTRDIIIKNVLAKISDVRPQDENDLKDVITARGLFLDRNKSIFDQIGNASEDNIDYVNFELEKIYQDQFDAYQRSKKNRDEWLKENRLIDDRIYEAKFDLGKLIVEDKLPVKIADLYFESTNPLDRLNELSLTGADKANLILEGINQDVIKLDHIPAPELIELAKNNPDFEKLAQDAKINIFDPDGLPQDADVNKFDPDNLPQDVQKNIFDPDNLDQTANINIFDPDHLPQDTTKNLFGPDGLPQDAEINVFDQDRLPQDATTNKFKPLVNQIGAESTEFSPDGLSQDATTNKFTPLGPTEFTIPNIEKPELSFTGTDANNPEFNLSLTGDESKNNVDPSVQLIGKDDTAQLKSNRELLEASIELQGDLKGHKNDFDPTVSLREPTKDKHEFEKLNLQGDQKISSELHKLNLNEPEKGKKEFNKIDLTGDSTKDVEFNKLDLEEPTIVVPEPNVTLTGDLKKPKSLGSFEFTDSPKNRIEPKLSPEEAERNKLNLSKLEMQSTRKEKHDLSVSLSGDDSRAYKISRIDFSSSESQKHVTQLQSTIYNSSIDQMDKDEMKSAINVQFESSDSKSNTTFSGPFYSVEPNKSFLDGKMVQVHPDKGSKSKLINKIGSKTNLVEPKKNDIEELKNNIYNKR